MASEVIEVQTNDDDTTPESMKEILEDSSRRTQSHRAQGAEGIRRKRLLRISQSSLRVPEDRCRRQPDANARLSNWTHRRRRPSERSSTGCSKE